MEGLHEWPPSLNVQEPEHKQAQGVAEKKGSENLGSRLKEGEADRPNQGENWEKRERGRVSNPFYAGPGYRNRSGSIATVESTKLESTVASIHWRRLHLSMGMRFDEQPHGTECLAGWP